MKSTHKFIAYKMLIISPEIIFGGYYGVNILVAFEGFWVDLIIYSFIEIAMLTNLVIKSSEIIKYNILYITNLLYLLILSFLLFLFYLKHPLNEAFLILDLPGMLYFLITITWAKIGSLRKSL